MRTASTVRALPLLTAAALLGACGQDDAGVRDRLRPAPPVELSGVVSTDEVTLEPPRVPTGHVSMTFANLTGRRVEVRLSRGATLASVVVPPHGTAQAAATLPSPGRYAVSAGGGARRAALVAAGTRPSSSDSLNLP